MAPLIRFSETMSGRFRPLRGGRRRPFEFTAAVSADRLQDWILKRPLSMRGTVTLGGIVRNVPLEGSLRIALPFGGRLEYEFFFRDRRGRFYRFLGKKEVSLFHFPSTMSTLKGNLFREGNLYGGGLLRFRWRDLPGFVKGFRINVGRSLPPRPTRVPGGLPPGRRYRGRRRP